MADQPTVAEQPAAREGAAEGEIGQRVSTKRSWRCLRRVGFATGSMSNLSPSNRAWSAVGALPMPTICDLPSHRRLAAKSATSSLSRSVEDTIAKFIAVVMKRRGGTRPVSIRPQPLARCG